MPLKINAGLSQKIGEPNFGSRGAFVNVELEVESALVNEPGKLKERIHQVFGLVREALLEELKGGNGQAHNHVPASDPPHANGNASPTNTDSRPNTSGPRPATNSQQKAIYAISKRRGINLEQLLQERFHVRRSDQLSIKDASKLIDELKNDNGG